jgi:class 3 adenylate cyclase
MSEQIDPQLITAAIKAQEQLRDTLGDAVVDAAIQALRAQLPTDESPAPVEHERRLVTVLFLDVVDSTRIFGGLDPEDMMTIMDAALETLSGPIHARGGRVTKFMGDGFLAVFGLRRTRENDAEMAVRAALEIVASARTIAAEVAHSHDVSGFDVRIGINTGVVATGGVTEAEDTVMGSAVNLASRIETAAPPGGVLVSQTTYRQVRRRFELESAGTIDAKGFPEPISVHLVKGERSDEPAEAVTGIDGLEAGMVGRDDELSALLIGFDDVVATGTARTVSVTGEAGIGKSRLIAEFESHLPPGQPVTVYRAYTRLENRDVPYAVVHGRSSSLRDGERLDCERTPSGRALLT